MSGRALSGKRHLRPSAPAKKSWTCPDRAEISPATMAANARFGEAANHPYPVPDTLDEKLAQLRDHWLSWRRGNAEIPFADDVSLEGLRNPGSIVLLQVFERPERFRFDVVGQEIVHTYGSELANKFADEVLAGSPLDYFLSQCSATVAAHAPTYYRHEPSGRGEPSYQRLLLPLWADGHIAGLLGAVSKT